MLVDVYASESFSEYFTQLAGSRGQRGGMKQELAEAMGSHPAYLSRVLKGEAQISLEQAERLATHLRMADEEKRYLLSLLQEERAGTQSLKRIFREDRNRLKHRRLNIQTRVPEANQVSAEVQAVYYGAWHHAAVHVLVSIPKFREIESIAGHLNLSLASVRDSVIFLENSRIIKRQGKRWVAGEYHLHLDRASPFIRQHHTNWRIRAIQALDKMSDADVRYSGMFSLSEKDAAGLKEKMIKHLKEYFETVKNSAEEKPYVFTFDFFEI